MIVVALTAAFAADLRVPTPDVPVAYARPLAAFSSVSEDPGAGACGVIAKQATPTVVEAFDVGLGMLGAPLTPWDKLDGVTATLTARAERWRAVNKRCRLWGATPAVLLAVDPKVDDARLMRLFSAASAAGFGELALLVRANKTVPEPKPALGKPLGIAVVRAENVQTSEGGSFSRMEAVDLDRWAVGLPPTSVLLVPGAVDTGRFATVWSQLAAAGRPVSLGFSGGAGSTTKSRALPTPTPLGDTVHVLVTQAAPVDFDGRMPTPPGANPKPPASAVGVMGALRDDGLSALLGDSSGIGGLIGSGGGIGSGGLGARGDGGGTAMGIGGLGARNSSPAGDPIILGALDRSLIDGVVNADKAGIAACDDAELAKTPTLAGKVVIKFVVSKDGTVSTADVKSTTLANPTVERCVADRFLRMQFPQPKGGGIVIVSYPFLFPQQ